MILKFLLNTQMISKRKKRKILILVDDMTVDVLSNTKCNPTVTELFIREGKLNISIVVIKKPYFAVPKNIRLNSTDFFIMKIPNKQELQQIAFNNSPDIDDPLASDNPLHFRKNVLENI